MKLEYLHDYFTPLPKLEPIMGKIKKTVLLPDEIKAFDNIGIKVTEPILTFRVLKRIHDQLHSYNHKSAKNGSICEIEPGKNFISIKYFCLRMLWVIYLLIRMMIFMIHLQMMMIYLICT